MQFTQMFVNGPKYYEPLRAPPVGDISSSSCSSSSSSSLPTGNGLGRTYLFVPLLFSLSNSKRGGLQHTFASIDWNLLEDIATNKMIPYLEPPSSVRLYIIILRTWIAESCGSDVCPWSCVCFLTLLTVHIITSWYDARILINATLDCIPDREKVLDYLNENQLPLACLLLLLWALLVTTGFNGGINAPKESQLNNSDPKKMLLISRHNPRVMHTLLRISSLTPMSPLSSVIGRIGRGTKDILSRSCLDPKQASFAHFIFIKTGECVKYPRQLLLEACVWDDNFHFWELPSATVPGKTKFLIPEQVLCAPVPLDVLFLASLSQSFLLKMERKVKILWACHSARQLQTPISSVTIREEVVQFSPLSMRLRQQCKLSWPRLLDNATTIHPVKYQTLEFLGDAVLGYALALNAMSRNSSLKWDLEDLTKMCSYAGKNIALAQGALRGGLNHLLQTQTFPWLSAYSYEADRRKQTYPAGESWESAPNGVLSADVSDFRLSDVVESVLGATYFARELNVMTKLLEILSLPFAEETTERKTEQAGSREPRPWVRSPSLCVDSGYAVGSDSTWKKTLSNIEFNMSQSLRNCLAARLENFTTMLQGTGSSPNFFGPAGVSKEQMRVVFFAALYDVDLGKAGEAIDDYSAKMSPGRRCHYQLAMVRDTLSCIGQQALSMIITEELMGRYPYATAADLHLLRRCALDQEVVAYVVVKMGLSSCLFDQGDGTAARYQSCMNEADKLGKELWDQRGGWLLEGGATEYRRRCRSYGPSQQRFLKRGPRYNGIVGGHLLRKQKQRGLGVDTSNLIFSFKALVGSVVLSLGVEKMWEVLGCYFEELLILSPEEVRQFGHLSPVVKACRPGTHEGKKKSLKYGILG